MQNTLHVELIEGEYTELEFIKFSSSDGATRRVPKGQTTTIDEGRNGHGHTTMSIDDLQIALDFRFVHRWQ